MPSLNWQEQPRKNTTDSGSEDRNIWFGISMGLLGLIVGIAATLVLSGKSPIAKGTNTPPPPPQVAQVPSTPPPARQAPAPAALPPVDFKTDHIRGNLKATVAVIEYSDFECPFCMRVEPTMKQISKEYGDKVMVVYRHFPLNFHANAQKEAEASDCAADQGKFWEYHDAIFEKTTGNGTGFPLENLVPLAKELGLNESVFKQCLDTGKYAKHVQEEEAGGQAAGVTGTPGNFVVNLTTQRSQMVSGAQPFSAFKSAIDVMLTDTAAPADTAERTIAMNAELWKFTPNVVMVKRGEKVTLAVTGVSGAHGLSIPGLGITKTIIQGQTVSIIVPTDKTGTFDFSCSVQCGTGHNDMKGQIIIEE